MTDNYGPAPYGASNPYGPPTTPPQDPYASYRSAAAPENPGQTLGIVALIIVAANLLGFPTALIGAILGHIAMRQSRDAGLPNIYAKIAIIGGWIITGLVALMFFLLFIVIGLAGVGYR